MNDSFPYQLNDVVGWIIRRRDGVVVKYNLISPTEFAKQGSPNTGKGSLVKRDFWDGGVSARAASRSNYSSGYKAWCSHFPKPADPPIFERDKIALYVAENLGAKQNAKLFDIAIDCGSVLDLKGEFDAPIIRGDEAFRSTLSKFVTAASSATATHAVEAPNTRLLKIRWYDRDAPPLEPAFWPALLKQLKSAQKKKGSTLNVLAICQGGHGRSGSVAAILTMLMTDYTPLDALTHIRALHCARAIESKVQHQYLNTVAEYLEREQNALEAEKVKSFKDRFLEMGSTFAAPYKDRVKGGKGATVETRDAEYL